MFILFYFFFFFFFTCSPVADEDGSSEAEWRRSPATSWANCVWLKLEHSFKSEWLNTPGHLSLSLLLSFTGEPWCEWFWFCTAASVAQSLQSVSFAQGAVKRMFRNKKGEKKRGAALKLWASQHWCGRRAEASFPSPQLCLLPVNPGSKSQNGLSHFL